jgi:NIMA (never in mitosis gene a)-related kinase
MPQDSTVNIVMEYARLGELSSMINERARSKAPFSEDEIMFWWVSAALAAQQPNVNTGLPVARFC